MKNVLVIISFLAIVLSSLGAVSANFACGVVHDAPNVSASWFEVKVHYEEAPEHETSCKISPEGNKFCCDPQEIGEVSWEIGKTLVAQVNDIGSGYYTIPERLLISGEGYDVFEDMQLQQGIAPGSDSVILGPDPQLDLKLSQDLEGISYQVTKDGNVLESGISCVGCDWDSIPLESYDHGVFDIQVNTESSQGFEVTRSFTYYNPGSLTLKRYFICDGCTGEYIPAGKTVNITLSLTSDLPLSMALKEFIPNDWEVVSGEAATPYSDTHKALTWLVQSGQEELSYTVRTPKTFLPKTEVVYSRLAGKELAEKTYTRYFLIRTGLFSKTKDLDKEKNLPAQSISFNRISPSDPLVYRPEKGMIKEFAIFPNRNIEGVTASYEDGVDSFTISSDLPHETLSRILVRLRLPEDEHDLTLVHESGAEYELTKISGNQDFKNLETQVHELGKFTLKSKERHSFFQRIFD